MGDDNPSVCQHVFDHAKAQRKPEIPPHSFSDNVRLKAVTVVKRGATVVHAILSTAEL